MATVFDVAQYILEKLGQITTIKLEKLVYYTRPHIDFPQNA